MRVVMPHEQPLSLDELVSLLLRRGMQVDDPAKAATTLLHVNYFRFCRYAWAFEVNAGNDAHQYQRGTTFDRVLRLYEFDAELRTLLLRHVQPVEIAFRNVLCHELVTRTQDPYWYLDEGSFKSGFRHGDAYTIWKARFDKSREAFASLFRQEHGPDALPPAWVMCEILSLSAWSIMFNNLAKPQDRKAVARRFEHSPYSLDSWIHGISDLRNLCAHGHCLWNRNFATRPRLSSQLKQLLGGNYKLSAQIAVLERMLRPLGRADYFRRDWQDLVGRYPQIPQRPMGHPDRLWQDDKVDP